MCPEITRELFERGDADAVLLYDPVLDSVILVEQFRIGALNDADGSWLLEIVAGIFEPNESPEQVALREAEEEAGCVITQLHPICHYYVSPGGTSERHYLYCGIVDASNASGIHGLPHEGEDILVHSISLDTALAWIGTGRINSSAPIIALQWLALNKTKIN